MKCKVGDMIRCIDEVGRDFKGRLVKGNVGKIKNIKTYKRVGGETVYRVGVDFEKGFHGHTLYGEIETNTGWFLDIDKVELAKRRMLIYRRENG